MSLWAIFITGLTTGGLSCMAVQGGLLAGYLAGRRNEGEPFTWRETVAPTANFLAAKLVGYTVVGALLGALGSFFQLSIGMRVALQILVGVFMLLAALKLLHVHPIFQKFEIRPPAAFRRILRRSAKGESHFTPLLLGFFTVFIPCGTTQAMEVLAIGSGSAAAGAAILAVFTLGTAPFFFGIGVLANTGARAFQGALAKATAVLVLAIGLYTINGGLALAGSPVTVQNLADAIRGGETNAVEKNGRIYFTPTGTGEETADANGGTEAPIVNGVQEVTLDVSSSGYSPKNLKLKKGVPVRLTLKTEETQGCARAFTMPSLNIQKVLPETGEEVIEFTPKKSGSLAFACSMGMFTGKFIVQ